MTKQTKVHGNTKKAADTSLAKKEISPESHAAIHERRISLEEARNLGRDQEPGTLPKPVSHISKSDRGRECMCNCGKVTKGGRFAPGHDASMHRLAREYVRGGRELTDEQMEYVEESGKLEKAKAQVAKESSREKAAE